ncbi:MAG TPA: peptide-methionine (S)-S-oxide reductase, partial [Bacillota bacterium]|nr:peptide-methionine (S)-S-oxide reductase [Bacillota bacterium]
MNFLKHLRPEAKQSLTSKPQNKPIYAKEIYLAGGCFWGTEKYLSVVNGVLATEVGYANGSTDQVTYTEVC